MRAALAVVGLWLASCVSSGISTCPGSDAICPEGTVCKAIAVWGPNGTAPVEDLCVPAADVAACNDLADLESCTAIDGAGQCHSGACFAPECGNHVLDVGEACDDADEELGDGCSQACTSDETCGNGLVDPIIDRGDGPVANERCDDADRVPHDGCSAVCDVELPRWRLQELGDPSKRAAAGMAFDSRRRRFVLFGGFTGTVFSANTTFTGELLACPGNPNSPTCVGWKPMTTPVAPTPRRNHAMTYDQGRDRVVLFGGDEGGFLMLDDVWEWNGRQWVQIQVTGNKPSRRSGGVMVYDPIHAVSVLYGGSNGMVPFSETWEWDGTQWAEHSTGPEEISGHSMAFDPIRGVVVLVGVAKSGTTITWQYDAGSHSWTDVTPAVVPPPRQDAGLAWDAETQTLMLFGGKSVIAPVAARTDVWHWNGQSWSEGVSLLKQLAGMAAVSDPIEGHVIAFGGTDLSTESNTLQRWDGESWVQAATPFITDLAMVEPAASYDPIRNRIVVVNQGQTWEVVDGQWLPSGASPLVVQHATIAYDAFRKHTVLFGGETSSFVSNRTFLWNGVAWTPVPLQVSAPDRTRAAMVFEADQHRVVLFGGQNDSGTASSETWAWDGSTWNRLQTQVTPGTRIDHAMGYDPVRHQVVLFGGRTSQDQIEATLGDTWIFDPVTSQWAPSNAVGPSSRKEGRIAWNPARRRLVLFGGKNGTSSVLLDTWEWDGEQWVELDLELVPDLRVGFRLTSTAHGVAFINSFVSPSTTPRVFELRWESTQIDDVCHDDRDVDGDGTIGCDDPDCRALCAPLCVRQATEPDPSGGPPTTVCVEGGPICGNGTCDLHENCRICAQDCACEAICGDSYCDAPETISSCPGDCSHVCGDAVCDPGETTTNCETDCPPT
jgi:cysteine-rich repeat protein